MRSGRASGTAARSGPVCMPRTAGLDDTLQVQTPPLVLAWKQRRAAGHGVTGHGRFTAIKNARGLTAPSHTHLTGSQAGRGQQAKVVGCLHYTNAPHATRPPEHSRAPHVNANKKSSFLHAPPPPLLPRNATKLRSHRYYWRRFHSYKASSLTPPLVHYSTSGVALGFPLLQGPPLISSVKATATRSSMANAAKGTSGGCGKKRKREPSRLGDLHDDMLERVLARLPPASYFRLRGVSRRWRAAPTPPLSAPPARAPRHDSANQDPGPRLGAVARRSPEPTPVAAAGGLVPTTETQLRASSPSSTPLTGRVTARSRCRHVRLTGVHRVVLILGELPKLSMATFDSTTNAWEDVVPLSRKTENDAGATTTRERETTRSYFLSKSGDVVATTMQQSASRQYTSAVVTANGEDAAAAVAYFLSRSGTVLPRILPAYHEYSIDVVACGGAAYAVVLSEFLDTASLRVQVAAMPPAMSHAFRGAKADVNCVGHADRVMVCVSSGDVAGARPTGGRSLLVAPTGDGEEATCLRGCPLVRTENGGRPNQQLCLACAFSFSPRKCKAIMRCSPMQQRKQRGAPAAAGRVSLALLWKRELLVLTHWTPAGSRTPSVAERHGRHKLASTILVGIPSSHLPARRCSPPLALPPLSFGRVALGHCGWIL
ncbi:hypothetical protein HU200_006898 [Digitaria exilis]|uniref:F-box domain-containing protein n=1 Tax=Digitaria exilis TaxID=1010633 RepID=A0A835FP45_9POAL|nr:hypothetical protein HU200_006898 [Digitaria exilis]